MTICLLILAIILVFLVIVGDPPSSGGYRPKGNPSTKDISELRPPEGSGGGSK